MQGDPVDPSPVPKEVHTRTHPARLTLDDAADNELAAELAEEEAGLAEEDAGT